MNRLFSVGQPLRLAIVVASLTACGDDYVNCVTPPCALPMAVTISLTSATAAGPVNNAIVLVTGSIVGQAPCSGSPTTCLVLGYPGTYSLDISAPGFQTARRNVTVTGSAPASCDCGSTETVHLEVALVAE